MYYINIPIDILSAACNLSTVHIIVYTQFVLSSNTSTSYARSYLLSPIDEVCSWGLIVLIDYDSDYDEPLARSDDFLVNGDRSLFNRVAPPPNRRSLKPPLSPKVNGSIPNGRYRQAIRDYETLRISIRGQRKGEARRAVGNSLITLTCWWLFSSRSKMMGYCPASMYIFIALFVDD